MTDLLALLKEAREWLHHGEDNCLNDNFKWAASNVLNRLDAAIAELEAAPERKPVAWLHKDKGGRFSIPDLSCRSAAEDPNDYFPVYRE